MSNKIEIVSDWDDSFLRCPSQCYLNMTFEGRYFVVYLRWRHSDPWSADLIECDADYNLHNPKYEWVELEVKDWSEEQVDQCKKEAIDLAKKLIYQRIKV